MSTPILVTFTLYLVGMLVLGVLAWRVTRNLSDYVLGGRRLSGAVVALSAGASGMSGWLLLALPGALYTFGLAQVWMAIGLSVGAYLNWTFVAARLRRYTAAVGDALTLSDYLENRFDDRSRLLRIASAAVILVFFTIYAASGLVSGALLFSHTFAIGYEASLWIGAGLIVSYTFLGGFLAVSWTDVVQGLLMLVALIAVPVVAMQEMGGWRETMAGIGTLDSAHLSAFSGLSGLGAVSLLAWGLGYFGQPHILARFMAARAVREFPAARLIGMGWMIIALYGAMFTGLVAFGYYADTPLANPETAFIALSQSLFNPWLAGILLAAILAAIMSTADSQLIVASSALTEDVYRAFLRRGASERELVWIGRSAVLVIALIAVFIGRDPTSRVLDLVAYAWAGFGAGFGPVILLSLLWSRMTRNGALAGMVAGTITVILWASFEGGIFDVYEILPGFLVNGITVIIVSLMGAKPPEAVRRAFAQILAD